jgi:hypothetical protein
VSPQGEAGGLCRPDCKIHDNLDPAGTVARPTETSDLQLTPET